MKKEQRRTIDMLKLFGLVLFILFQSVTITKINAQTSASDNLVAQPIPDRTITFDITDTGISKTIEFGADLAWASKGNFRRNILFMGKDQVDLVRASFQPKYPLVNDTALAQEQINDLNYRLSLIGTYVGPNTDLTLNCDHPWVDDWYVGHPDRWAQLIKASTQMYLDAGHNVITIGAFNEPDYGWGQGSAQDMYDITALLNSDPFFDGVRFSGGNTLNCDKAQWWYDYLTPAGVNEGNTHQLSGSFDSFANFYKNVRSHGHHATADELHNIVEALVGYEYGMQTGIWWADIDLASGEMAKAFDGERIGYAEHRSNWTAAAVYRHPDGKVQAFGGTSERQAKTTSFRFVSKDRDVYYDGYGPQREYTLVMPGGTSYQNGQTNAERVINITWGDDIQPVIDGRYILVNKKSGKVMEVANGSTSDGANIQQGTNAGKTYQQWDVTPVDSRIGGDFSFFKIAPASNSAMAIDNYNFSLDNGNNIVQWTSYVGPWNGANQQWYLEYAEDGWFYIRNRVSSLCLEVANSGTGDGANIQQMEKQNGTNQQWRFLPIDAFVEFVSPPAPTNLAATANSESVVLEWSASVTRDAVDYTIFRSESAEGPYNTIARNISTTSYLDNTATIDGTYYYAVKAVDNSLNRSEYSNQASATVTGSNDLVAHFAFEENTLDSSINLNHGATYGSISYGTGNVGEDAIILNGTDAFVQLSPTLANQQEITVATWVYWNGGANWQRIFDFGNDQDEYMFLTPKSASNRMVFSIKNGTDSSQSLETDALPSGKWVHIALTLGASGAKIYQDGQLVAELNSINISPLDFKPVLNYIGRSQYPDPLLNGRIDDFRVYNYTLSDSEIEELASDGNGGTVIYPAIYSVSSEQNGNPATNLLDGDNTDISRWSAEGFPQTVIIDYGQNLSITGTRIWTYEGRTYQYTVELDDNTDFTSPFIVDRSSNTTTDQPIPDDFAAVTARYARITVTGASDYTGTWVSLTGFDIIADTISASTTIHTKDSDLLVYPNPATNLLTIEAVGLKQGEVAIYNVQGKQILAKRLNGTLTTIDVHDLLRGVYLIKVSDQEKIVTKRFIKE